MEILRQSIRFYIGLIIVLMGLLGLVFALTTGEYYREIIFEHQRAALANLGALEARQAINELDRRATDLGLGVQQDRAFREAYEARDVARLVPLLDRQFHQYFVTAGVLNLEKLLVFDRQVELLAVSGEPSRLDGTPMPACPGLAEAARQRSGAERIRPLKQLCRHGGEAYLSVLVPIGTLTARGYLQVVVDPGPLLSRLGDTLGLAVRLRTVGGREQYRSPHWPEAQSPAMALVGTTVLHDGAGEPLLELAVAGNTGALAQELEQARGTVLGFSVVATLAMVLVALLVLQYTTIRPIEELRRKLGRIRRDRSRIGERITVVGNSEVMELADDFNELSSELGELHETLESLAYNDTLTGLPNRVLFRDRLDQQLRLAEREQRQFALLAIDLNGFKGINDTLGHQAGDRLLQEVGRRLRRVLRRSDTVAYTGHTLARLGGDEFSIILPLVRDVAGARRVAIKLLDAVSQPFELNGQTVHVGMSVGIAMFPDHAADFDQLCHSADLAMYDAKRRGGGLAVAAGRQQDTA